MKAWLLDRQDGIGNLRLADVDDPRPAAGEALLEVEFAALNPADRYLAEGQYPARPAMPHILGRDGVGRVIALGGQVDGLAIGDRRMLMRSEVGVERAGMFAEKVAVPAASLVEIPEGWTPPESAGATLVYLTAYQALTQFGALPPSTVLITGASGGVGVAAIHLAAAKGHTVVALSRDHGKFPKLMELGARHCADPSDSQWRRAVRDALGDKRVDLIIDNIGGRLLPEAIELLGFRGKISIVGRLAGPVPNFNTSTLLFRRLQMGGVAVGAYTPDEARTAWSACLDLLRRARRKPLVDQVFPFEQLPAAFEKLARGTLGKIVLQVKN